MAVTLLEASKLVSGNVLRQGVIETFAEFSDLLRVWPFETINGNAYQYNREGELPGIAFRGVNSSFTESTGIVNPLVEALKIAGGDLDVDKFLIRTLGPQIKTTHQRMKIKALSLMISKKIIKGDVSSDPLEFDGLQNRFIGAQKIANGTTDGGDVLSLAKLDQLIDAVDSPTHLIMNKTHRRRLTAASRLATVGGDITRGVDEFGRQVTKYNDLPVLIVGQDEAGDEIIPFTELGYTGSTATASSIYCVSLGDGMLTGLQSGVMDVRDLGEQDAKPVDRTRVEWDIAIAAEHARCGARLYGIKDGAVVV